MIKNINLKMNRDQLFWRNAPLVFLRITLCGPLGGPKAGRPTEGSLPQVDDCSLSLLACNKSRKNGCRQYSFSFNLSTTTTEIKSVSALPEDSCHMEAIRKNSRDDEVNMATILGLFWGSTGQLLHLITFKYIKLYLRTQCESQPMTDYHHMHTGGM